MTRFVFIIKTFLNYLKANLLVAFGVAICAAVLTGSLIIGDSIRYSLEQSTFYRLGNTIHLITATDRYFREQLAEDLTRNGKIEAAPVLLLEGIAVTEGGKDRVNKTQVIGVDSHFDKISGTSDFSALEGNQVIISSNLAERLQLKKGDEFLLRIKKASLIPLNAPFVSDAQTSVPFRAVVKGIAARNGLGFFNLKNSQTAPYNIFLSLSRLNELMNFKGKANNILISGTNISTSEMEKDLQRSFNPADAGIQVKDIAPLHVKQIVSERVFLEDPVVRGFQQFANSSLVLTYFVNAIQDGDRTTPYSFVTAIDSSHLTSAIQDQGNNNSIILNNWTANDLGAKEGDSIRLKYFAVGPLRQLVEKEEKFILKKIVPIQGVFADQDLMPSIPGLADAKSCHDWEAGVPINLGAIRDKDEKYWNQFKGTPKAFISMSEAQRIWSNRFGNYTAIQVPEKDFSDSAYHHLFSTSVKPSDIGISIIPVRQNGLNAARNGVDFSQLFLGLSFFLLFAALLLISLLFLLNLENRRTQMGTLSILGFTGKQQRKMLLQEGAVISLIGSLLGLIIAFFYTKLIFHELNTLWWSIVRTSVLELKILPSTLFLGLTITMIISLLTIFFSVNRSSKKRAAELQRQQDKPSSPKIRKIKRVLMLFFIFSSILLTGLQLLKGEGADPALFFLSGTLILIGLLLMADLQLSKSKHLLSSDFSENKFILRNKIYNRRRSLLVIILFAIGTFLVISTGANRQEDLTSNDKSSGTGGFLFYAETTVPVLYDLNDKDRRIKEGITEPFNAVQFHRMSGDDASCLNLNKVTNPAILGVDTKKLQDRFSFSSKVQGLSNDPWHDLTDLRSAAHSNIIPAIADQTVIQWSLGKKIGDTLFYKIERGDTLGLRLIAGLSPSIFQGYVLISDQNFLRNYPTTSGTSLFLIDGPENRANQIGEELKENFRDNGWEMTTTGDRLMEFNSVENTYLSIFLALGALGLILGTIGLAIVLARSILERKSEIALLQALGFTRKHVRNVVIKEYSSLLSRGLLIGLFSAAVAVWPNITARGSEIPFWFILILVLIILANGILWIILLSWYSLKSKEILSSLRNENR